MAKSFLLTTFMVLGGSRPDPYNCSGTVGFQTDAERGCQCMASGSKVNPMDENRCICMNNELLMSSDGSLCGMPDKLKKRKVHVL